MFNEGHMKAFKPTHGIHQGRRVSPYLFLLMDESLSCLLKHAMTSNEMEGFKILGRLQMLITCYLQMIAFTQMHTKMMEILDVYCLASGQKS
jgi:hypothetical protein